MEIVIDSKNTNIDIKDILSDDMVLIDNGVILQNISCMPIAVKICDNSIIVNIPEFSCENDFEIAKKIIQNIEKLLNVTAIYEKDYEKVLRCDITKLKDKDLVINYIKRPVFISKEHIQKLLNSDNLLENFSKLVYKVQYNNYYVVQNRDFYDSNGVIITMFYVNKGLDNLMQYVPYSIKKPTFISIVDKIDNKYETLNVLKYTEFFEKIDNKYLQFIDSNNVVVKKNFEFKPN